MRFLIAAAALSALWSVVACARGEDVASGPSPTVKEITLEGNGLPLGFRRCYAPADAIDRWPDGGLQLRPIDKSRVEEILAALTAPVASDSTLPSVEFMTGDYSASLEGDMLVDGSAVVDVRLHDQAPVAVDMNNLGLAVRAPTWESENDEPAHWGTDAGGANRLLVERSGRLAFQWTLRGQADDTTGELTFRFALPEAAGNRLRLELPDGYVPEIGHGIVSDEGVASPGLRRWRIELGAVAPCVLTIKRDANVQQTLVLPRVSQLNAYACSRRGVTLTTRLVCEKPFPTDARIMLFADSEVGIRRIMFAKRAINDYQILEESPGSELRRIEIQLPVDQVAGQELLIESFVPLRLDYPWLLPRVYPSEEQFFWQETSSTLAYETPLELLDLSGEEVRIQGVATDAGTGGRSVTIQHLAREAAPVVRLSLERTTVRRDSGTVLQLGNGEASAETVMEYVADGRETRLLLRQRVTPGWTIDAVEQSSAQTPFSWAVEEENGRDYLAIRLTAPLSAEEPMRLIVRAHRPYSAQAPALNGRALLPLVSENAGDHYLDVHAAEGYRIDLPGGAVQAMPLDGEEAEESARLLSPSGLFFVNPSRQAGLRLTLHEQPPEYAIDVALECAVFSAQKSANGPRIEEQCRIACTPRSGRVGSLILTFSDAYEPPSQWAFSEVEGQVEEVLTLTPVEDAGARASDRRRFRLAIPASKGGLPFVVRATRTRFLDDALRFEPPGFPESGECDVRVAVSAADGVPPRIRHEGLHRLPNSEQSDASEGGTGVVFAAKPADTSTADENAYFELVRPTSENEWASAWAWKTQLETWYEDTGRASHRASYWIENHGRNELGIVLGDTVGKDDVVGVWIDGRRVAWEAGQAGESLVMLAPDVRFCVVSICFSTRESLRGMHARFTPPTPRLDIPEFNRRWAVRVPPSFETISPSRRSRASEEAAAGCGAAEFWAERLSTTCDAKPFNPLSVPSMALTRFMASDARTAQAKAGLALRRIAQIAISRSAQKNSASLKWGDLLTDSALEDILADTSEGRVRLELVVDAPALLASGVTPDTVVPTGQFAHADASEKLGWSVLNAGDLALVLRKTQLIVTTVGAASRLAHAHAADDDSIATWVFTPDARDGDVHAQRAADGILEESLIVADFWRMSFEGEQPPWASASALHSFTPDMPDWEVLEIPLGRNAPPPTLIARHKAMFRSLWALTFLAAGGLGGFFKWPSSVRVLVAGALALAGTLATVLYAPMFWAGAYGTLCGLAFHWLRVPRQARLIGVRSRRVRRPGENGSSADRATPPPAVGLLLLLALTSSVSAAQPFQQEGPTSRAVAAPATTEADPSVARAISYSPIFIPVDDEGVPVGEKYYLDADFYEQLVARFEKQTRQDAACRFRSAFYKGELIRSATGELTPGQFTATFELDAPAAPTRVRVPLPGASPVGATLDGQAVRPRWAEANGDLVFQLDSPGIHRLRLEWRAPAVQANEGGGSLAFDIPRISDSRLELVVPTDLDTVDAPGALGAVQRDDDGARVCVDFGAVARADIAWKEASARRARTQLLESDDLLWLQMRRYSAVSLKAQLRYRVIDGAAGELQLGADPRLSRKEFSRDGVRVSESDVRDLGISTIDGVELRVFAIALETPVTDQTVVEATFSLDDFRGAGRIRAPIVRSLEARNTKRWMAVSADPGLIVPAPPESELVLASGFLSAWGDATAAAPHFAFQLDGQSPVALDVMPAHATLDGDSTFDMLIGPEYTDVRYEALVTPSASVYQYRFDVPADMKISRISVKSSGANDEEDSEQVASWRRVGGSTAVAMLKDAAKGRQQIYVEGRIATEIGVPKRLAPIALENMQAVSQRVRLFCRHDVVAEIHSLDDATTDSPVLSPEESVDQGIPVSHRFAAEWDSQQMRNEAALVVLPNNPSVQGRQRTSLYEEGTAWRIECELDLDVTEGILDELRLKTPDAIDSERAEITSRFQIDVSRDPESGELVLRPRSPAKGKFNVMLTAPVRVLSDEPLSLPVVEASGVQVTDHVIVLPIESQDMSPLHWTTRGLDPTPLPEGAVPQVSREAYAGYRARGRRFDAILGSEQRPAIVELADIAFAEDLDGAVRTLAVFDLDVGRMAACDIILPDSAQVQGMTLDDVAVYPLNIAPGRWRLSTGLGDSFRRLAVMYQLAPGQVSQGDAPEYFLPRLEAGPGKPLTVKKTLWSVSCARTDGRVPATGALQLETARLRSIATIMDQLFAKRLAESESSSAAEDPRLGRWAARWAETRRNAAKLIALRQGGWAGELNALDQWAESNAVDALAVQANAKPGRHGLAQLWNATQAETSVIVDVGVADSAPAVIRPSFEDLRQEADATSYRAVILILALMFSGFGMSRSVWCRQFIRRWPQLSLVCLGLAWWLWMWPSTMGLALVAVALLSFARSAWPGVSRSQSSSRIRVGTE